MNLSRIRQNVSETYFLLHSVHAIMSDFQTELTQFMGKLQPSHIIIGGGITTRQKSRIANALSHLQNTSGHHPRISISSLGDDAGLYGALEVIRRGTYTV